MTELTAPPEKRLRDLSEELQAWKDTLEGMGEEEADAHVAAAVAEIARLKAMYPKAVDREAGLIQWAKKQAAEMRDAALRFQSRAKAFDRIHGHLRERLTESMKSAPELGHGQRYTVVLMPGAKKIVVDDVSQIPKAYVTWEPPVVTDGYWKANIDRIAAALADDPEETIDGVRVIPGTPYIQIR